MPKLLRHQIKRLSPDFLACLLDYSQHNNSSTPLTFPVFWPFVSSISIRPYFIFISSPTKQKFIIWLFVCSTDRVLNVLAISYPLSHLRANTLMNQTTHYSTLQRNSQSLTPVTLQCWSYTVSFLTLISFYFKSPHSPQISISLFAWKNDLTSCLKEKINWMSSDEKGHPFLLQNQFYPSDVEVSPLIQGPLLCLGVSLIPSPDLEYFYNGLSFSISFISNLSHSTISFLKLPWPYLFSPAIESLLCFPLHRFSKVLYIQTDSTSSPSTYSLL